MTQIIKLITAAKAAMAMDFTDYHAKLIGGFAAEIKIKSVQ